MTCQSPTLDQKQAALPVQQQQTAAVDPPIPRETGMLRHKPLWRRASWERTCDV
ncbi:hypothetical protein HC928_02960 [bacterium]|nr:hypothetical protein [bacterium]